MDTAKLRLAAAAVTAIAGIVGVSTLVVAGVLALEPRFGLALSATLVGAGLCLVAVASLLFVTQPDTPTEKEISAIESLTAEALADLPFDTVKAIIEKRPMASLAIAATTGYTLSRDPESAVRNLKRAMAGLF